MSHTKGTWKCLGKLIISEDVDENLIEIANLCSPRVKEGPQSQEEYRANGFLIASAPELFLAAQEALKLIRGSGFTDNTKAIIELKAAINKAEGKWD